MRTTGVGPGRRAHLASEAVQVVDGPECAEEIPLYNGQLALGAGLTVVGLRVVECVTRCGRWGQGSQFTFGERRESGANTVLSGCAPVAVALDNPLRAVLGTFVLGMSLRRAGRCLS